MEDVNAYSTALKLPILYILFLTYSDLFILYIQCSFSHANNLTNAIKCRYIWSYLADIRANTHSRSSCVAFWQWPQDLIEFLSEISIVQFLTCHRVGQREVKGWRIFTPIVHTNCQTALEYKRIGTSGNREENWIENKKILYHTFFSFSCNAELVNHCQFVHLSVVASSKVKKSSAGLLSTSNTWCADCFITSTVNPTSLTRSLILIKIIKWAQTSFHAKMKPLGVQRKYRNVEYGWDCWWIQVPQCDKASIRGLVCRGCFPPPFFFWTKSCDNSKFLFTVRLENITC